MAVPGIRSVADARQRLMANPESQAAWSALDCGFAAVADVFDECYAAAKRVIAGDELPDFLEAARVIGKLGRGAEPLLAFLEHWPNVVATTGLASSAMLPPVMAAIQTQRRTENIDALIAQGEQWAGKLVEQDDGVKRRGRKLSDSGAKARFFHAVSEAHLSKIIKVDLAAQLFSYDIDAEVRTLAEMMDGKLLLVTNVQGLTPDDIVSRYKSLADIERGFRVLKSEIEIAPVFHRLPERIRAHASICFMALVLHRVMRQRLRLAGSTLSPEAALQQLRRVQRHRVRIDGAEPIAGISTIHQDQADTLDALNIKKPSLDAQMSLL